ncbi:response regulator transcription factor [Bradyrhizobium sp. WSM1417]|nr:response regulator [Bradyrhizobium sp. WSM1417]
MAPKSAIVIVLDDDASFLKGVARLLALDGIEAGTFSSAEALIESGRAQTATCLLLDINLGGISGIELYRRLTASGSKCPVIFMTANDDVATRHEAVDGTAQCIPLAGPFEIARVAASRRAAISLIRRARSWSVVGCTGPATLGEFSSVCRCLNSALHRSSSARSIARSSIWPNAPHSGELGPSYQIRGRRGTWEIYGWADPLSAAGR